MIIAVDPRRTETADFADLHLPIRPDAISPCSTACSSAARRGLDRPRLCRATHPWLWRAHWGHQRYIRRRSREEICGVPNVCIVEAALIFGKAERAMSLWSMGVNQSTVGVHKNKAIHQSAPRHRARSASPGCGPFSLTGQPNAMGGREVGGLVPPAAGLPERPGSAAPRRGRALLGGAYRWHLASSPAYGAGTIRSAGRQARSKRSGFCAPIPRCRCRTLDLIEKALAPSGAGNRARCLSSHRHERASPTCCCRRRSGARKKG